MAPTKRIYWGLLYRSLIYLMIDGSSNSCEWILFKEILVQDHFYREIFFITSFFELDNCLPLLRMNKVTTRNMSLTVRRGWAWGYVSAEYSAKYTAVECLSIYGFVISMIALFDISVLRNLFFIVLIIIWLPLSTFWRRSKNWNKQTNKQKMTIHNICVCLQKWQKYYCRYRAEGGIEPLSF